MPIPMASSVFHGSCPTRPGKRYARTSSASGAGASGSVIRPAAKFIGRSSQMKKAAEAAFYLLREGTSTRGAALSACRHRPRRCASGRSLLGRLGRRLLSRVFLAELLDTAGGVDDLLLARVERVAGRTHLYLQVSPQRRAGLESVPAAAGDGDFLVIGMEFGFHGVVLACAGR